MEPRLYQGQALRVCAVRTALTEPSLPAPPEGGKGDGAAGAPHLHLRRGSGSGAHFQRATHKFCGRGERLGYTVTMRTSSLEALALFQGEFEQFDAVITDQTMPDMTGIDLARQMLKIRPDIPIILCTGYSNLITEEQARAYGVKGFIMKPMTKRGISTLLRNVLDDTF